MEKFTFQEKSNGLSNLFRDLKIQRKITQTYLALIIVLVGLNFGNYFQQQEKIEALTRQLNDPAVFTDKYMDYTFKKAQAEVSAVPKIKL